jgi:hypothetical protein
VATLPLGTPAYQALETLKKLGRSALGLVDGDGRLVGNFSLSDLRGIKPETMFGQLTLAVEQFIMINAMANMKVHGFRCAQATHPSQPRRGGEGASSSGLCGLESMVTRGLVSVCRRRR